MLVNCYHLHQGTGCISVRSLLAAPNLGTRKPRHFWSGSCKEYCARDRVHQYLMSREISPDGVVCKKLRKPRPQVGRGFGIARAAPRMPFENTYMRNRMKHEVMCLPRLKAWPLNVRMVELFSFQGEFVPTPNGMEPGRAFWNRRDGAALFASRMRKWG